ncbi:hypothetical protein G9464_13720 [Halostella sp. JP-L12]|uniref:hypothetical protein n=1 Tax=Halostella TaxID=1843185 RepID=UPI000EF8436F|nr:MULTISPECIES: hypothetical protein [Halostella]NHN48645.1 hypothetical protein [Halostella sp. JP-L12]
MTINYSATTDPTGVKIVDRVEQRQFTFRTADPVDPSTIDTDGFRFPVTHACRFETGGLYFDRLDGVCVRNADGDFLATVNSHERHAFDSGSYSVDIGGPVKVYFRVADSMVLETGANHLYIDFGGTPTIDFGSRSYHKTPAATITVPDDPYDLMAAVSALSSALKTTSCERSYPTLRGHPPLLTPGEELHVPDELESPNTGIRIYVPPEYRHIYTVSSLAFYLGADVVPGEVPRIETAGGFEWELASRRWFEDEVARVLKQIFFLDCIVRTEGLYQIDLRERQMVEPHLPFELSDLYGRPLREQIQQYLKVPYDLVTEYVPDWSLTAHIPSSPDGIRPLPFVVNDLGIVREPRGTRISQPRTPVASYSRSPGNAAGAGQQTASKPLLRSDAQDVTDSNVLVEPETTNESIEHAWFGDHVPRGATKATVEAFENRLSRDERTNQIDIAVVCNDERMLDEYDSLDGVYGSREELPFNVESHTQLSKEELAAVLRDGGHDFLHYIGHATPDGLRCADGKLDVRELDSVDVEVFLLNACRSYNQAKALAERGATGGVGTLSDIVNEHAVEIGKAMARLLHVGFPLRVALQLVRDHTSIGDQYLIVGDGSADMAQSGGGATIICDISANGKETYDLQIAAYPTQEYQLGSFVTPTVEGIDENILLPGKTKTIELTKSELKEYLSSHQFPIQFRSELHWNDEMSEFDF